MADGSFTGGDKLKARLAAIKANLATATAVRTGFLEDAVYPDGTSVAMVAAIQEFGAPRAGIPPRPFFRNAIKQHQREWAGQLGVLLRKNDYNAAVALGLMGELIAGEITQSITETNDPPLSAVTLMLREMRHKDPDLVVTGKTVGEAARRVAAGESYSGASTKPLVDTGVMLGRVRHEVVTS